jgi:hypothetical protein
MAAALLAHSTKALPELLLEIADIDYARLLWRGTAGLL